MLTALATNTWVIVGALVVAFYILMSIRRGAIDGLAATALRYFASSPAGAASGKASEPKGGVLPKGLAVRPEQE